MSEQDRNIVKKVILLLEGEMERWQVGKQTGQLQLELNYSCGGLSKVYLTTKKSMK
jgi:hypothetical protein